MTPTLRVTVAEATQVSEARRVAAGLAMHLGFSDEAAGRVAIVSTELASNLVKHAGGGEIIFQALEDTEIPGMIIVALDQGPGMSNVPDCFQDGYSTSGSPGTGLGAVTRLSESWEVDSKVGSGTAIAVRLFARNAPAPRPQRKIEIGGFSIAKPGETDCGDAWAMRQSPSGCTLLVVDGLGHGILAAEAAGQAVACFAAAGWEHSLADLLKLMHDALKPTRGAAAAIADLNLETGIVRYLGIGNIAGSIINGQGTRHLVSMNGILGHEMRHVREFQYNWTSGSLLVLHSDGLATRWDLQSYPGLLTKSAGLIAAVLYRDWKRGRDDTTVIIAREKGVQ